MKRYKIAVSDFHVGPGQLQDNGDVNPLEYFIFDSRFVSFLEHYSTEEYKAADVELIINGDFLNTIQVDDPEEKLTRLTEKLSVAKVRRIFAGHPELFDALQKFAAVPNHRVAYLVGNHDPHIVFPQVQEAINYRLQTEVFFPGFRYEFDGIWIEHGHQYQPANYCDPAHLFSRDEKGDEVLHLPWGSVWIIEYLNEIKKQRPYIDRIQPFSRYLLLAFFFDPLFAFGALGRLLAFFFRLRFSHGLWKDPREFAETWKMLSDLSIIPPLDREAQNVLARPEYHTVLFGHNHQAAYRRFGRDRLYVNTGTWNDIIHLDIQNLGRQRRMTYAFIDYPDHLRPRTKLKIWKGTKTAEEDVIF